MKYLSLNKPLIYSVVLFTGLMVLLMPVASVLAQGPPSKVDICHWNGSSYEAEEVQENQITNNGEGEGLHQNHDHDIIPLFDDYSGKNWNSWDNAPEGYGDTDPQDIYNNGECDGVPEIQIESIDLSVDKSVDNSTPEEGGTIVYTIEVTNIGSSVATNVIVDDVLPDGVTYVSDDSSGDYDEESGEWNIGSLASEESVTLNITVTVDEGTEGQTITNTATASADEEDADSENDSNDADITVQEIEEEEGYEFPSTNDDNRENGWAHVNLIEARVGELTLEFVNPRSFASCFEYRTDGDTSQATGDPNYNVDVPDLYPFLCLNNENVQEIFEADEYVEVRSAFGAEADERFDWTRFDVLQAETATIVAHKVVCESEEDLPNWAEGVDVDENTAQNWVDEHDSCEFEEDWEFQWAYGGITNSEGDDSFVGPKDSPWTTFGPTDGNGMVSTEVVIEEENRISLREVLKEGFIPFTFLSENKKNTNDFSAEFYCTSDGGNYDNLEWVDLGSDETYHCVGFNAPVDPDPNDEHQLNLSGHKFNNENGDRDQDEGEENLPGWEMRLYKEVSGVWDLIANDTTDEEGKYSFPTQQEAGTYHICEVEQEGWSQVKQDWSGTPYHIVTDNESPNSSEEGEWCATITYTDEADRSSKKYFGNIEGEVSEITLPANDYDSYSQGMIDLAMFYADENGDGDDSILWAVREGTCQSNSNSTVLGNVDSRNDPYNWDGTNFSAIFDASSANPGDYCFVVNPQEDSGDNDQRLTRWFTIEEENNEEEQNSPPVIFGGSSNGSPSNTNNNNNNGTVLGATTLNDEGGEVLGESCQPVITTYIRPGVDNDPEEVKKLQQFLNEEMGANLLLTGFYDSITQNYVEQFQLKYAEDILAPWEPFGLDPNTPTGYVYKTTQWWINVLSMKDCIDVEEIPFPELP